MLHHKTVVGGDIRLTLYTIKDYALSLCGRRRAKLDECREASTTHTCYTSHLDAVDDFFRCELRMLVESFESFAAVDALFPLVALYINIYGRLAIASGIDSGVDL